MNFSFLRRLSPLLLLTAHLFSSRSILALDITPPTVATNSTTATSSSPTTPQATPQLTGIPTLAPPSYTLVSHDLPEIHAKILLPKDWTLLPGKLLEGDILLATREKITNENDPWITGLSLTIDRNGAKDSGQKASVYALSLAREAKEKAGEEASPLRESQLGASHEVRFDFSVPGDQPLLVTEVLRANDDTGTLTVILWQSSKEESVKLQNLKESILAGLQLDPAQ
jgi:hypothetical protein